MGEFFCFCLLLLLNNMLYIFCADVPVNQPVTKSNELHSRLHFIFSD